MATGLPAGQSLDIEFTPGVWTPVGADVLFLDGIAIGRGRNSVFSVPSVGTMTATLDNSKGKYTPLRQVLADGVTAHPYWPNVIPRRRMRYVNTPAGTRAVGYIRSFPPGMKNGVLGQVTLVADDRLKLLDKDTLVSPVVQEQLNDNPTAMWVLNDAAFSTTATERLSGAKLSLKGTGPAPLFAGTAVNAAEGTTVSFTPSSATVGQVLLGSMPSVVTPTISAWINAGSSLPSWGTGSQIQYFMGCSTGTTGAAPSFGLQGGVLYYTDPFVTVTGGPNLADGKWHHVAVSGAAFSVATLSVDGVAVATSAGNRGSTAYTRAVLGANPDPSGGFGFGVNLYQGALASVALYPSGAAPSAARLAAHAAAGAGYAGDTTGTRIQRYLLAAGLTSADWNLDPGVAKVGTYPQAGQSVLAACQAMADTEGGGSVFYVATDGRARFTDRNFRKPGTVAMTMDAVTDLLQSPFAPDYSDEGLFNSSAVPRANATGVLSTQTSADANSKNTYQASADPGVTSYATTDADALGLAQWRVAVNRTPGYRLPQVAVDLVTAENNLYAALGGLEIGERVRITNLPAAVAPTNQLDCIVEGWTETITPDSYVVQFDLSPSDNPAFLLWGGSTANSRWQAQGQTLNTTITATATTVLIATTGSGNPTLTTSAGAYPMTVQIDQEVLTFPTAPSGSTSPQTFTGVQRGTQGTPKAGHTAGALFQLWPASTWSL